MTELQENIAQTDNSIADIKILNNLMMGKKENEKTRTGQATPNVSQLKTSSTPKGQEKPSVNLPSMELFKRMINMKREKQHLERELATVKDLLEESKFLNKKLDEALTHQQEKVKRLEIDMSKQKQESTNIGDNSLFKEGTFHKRKFSFDPKFLAQASP
eukprot:CAMPEP_0170544810 /NCGR_PEP_ID=MMETSP0211-20121228/3432_1 /TAXON_ID=311385 /ORGANISM="Pseudokeronopsis sp., Strain OXSARD2" /LENGTH=158 /DNA_ID=CAMNT_0010848551 /DNA_START=604 /DNA_END=1080 /DNA_ORIENTATION=-